MTNYAGVAVMVCVLAPTTVVGFSLVGQRWTTDVVPVELQLGDAAGLVDGSADWDMCARQSLAAWNAALQTTAMRFTAVRGMSRPPAAFDGINSIVFAADVFGTPFGPSLVSATQTFAMVRDGVDETIEADVLVNQAQPFNCYRGAMQPGPVVYDLQRTVTHALGHVIGLGHPDAAGQTVAALMNAELDAVDVLQANDIEGALTLAGGALVGIPFPPRNEAFTFYESLETEYRDTLQRSQTNEGYVDAEGSAVWFPEWLRYVLNGCEATEATTRVLMQIRGQGIQPVCRDVALDSYAFPPRNLSLDFLEALDAFYRDELQRRVELSHVNLEGKAVWLQEYLRYRVDGVSDADARSQVLTQIQEADDRSDTDTEVPVTDGGTVIGTQRYNLVGFAAGPQAGEPAEYGQTVMADVHTLEDGSYRMYYTTRHATGNHVRIAHSADARSWTSQAAPALSGSSDTEDYRFECGGATTLDLEGTDIRMFVRCTKKYTPGEEKPDYAIYSALSHDGLSFEHEAGARIDNSGHEASSPWLTVGHGRVYTLPDGTLGGIFSVEADDQHPADLALFTSVDEGMNWTYEKTLYQDWHDPVVFKRGEQYVMFAYYLLEYPAMMVSEDGRNWPEEVTQLELYDPNTLSDDGDSGGRLPYDDGHADLGALVLPGGQTLLYTNFNGSIGVYEPE